MTARFKSEDTLLFHCQTLNKKSFLCFSFGILCTKKKVEAETEFVMGPVFLLVLIVNISCFGIDFFFVKQNIEVFIETVLKCLVYFTIINLVTNDTI